MNETRVFLEESQAVILERHVLDRLVQSGDADAALLYLCLLRDKDALPAAARQLHKTQDWVEQTLARLIDLGLVRKTEAAAAKPEKPTYTSEEIAQEMESGSPFPALVGETQRRLGRALSTTELKILFGLYDHLELPPEVISLLVTYCMEEQKRLGGAERPLRLRQVEREAFRWKRQGADTLERAEAHLKDLARRREKYGEIFQLFQLEARAPSPSERTYLDGFLDMGFPLDAIALAYDKTMLQTGSLKWTYLNSILKRWHQKNLHTVEEIQAGDFNRPAPKKAGESAEPDKGRGSVAWMQELVRKQRQDDRPPEEG